MKAIPNMVITQSKILILLLVVTTIFYIWQPEALDFTLIKNILLSYSVIVGASFLFSLMTMAEERNKAKENSEKLDADKDTK